MKTVNDCAHRFILISISINLILKDTDSNIRFIIIGRSEEQLCVVGGDISYVYLYD